MVRKSSRPKPKKTRRTHSTHERPEPDGVAAHLMDAQRKLWQTGASAITRGAKLSESIRPAAFAESLQGGIRKLEEVFDQRVLNALSNAGMPSPEEIRALQQQVASLSAEVKRLNRKRSKE